MAVAVMIGIRTVGIPINDQILAYGAALYSLWLIWYRSYAYGFYTQTRKLPLMQAIVAVSGLQDMLYLYVLPFLAALAVSYCVIRLMLSA